MLQKGLSELNVLEKSLNAYWKRNETISNNIANVDTPGYKRKDVKFEEALAKAVKKTEDASHSDTRTEVDKKQEASSGSRSVDRVEPEVYTQNEGYSYRLDGNNVDIDNEMAELAKNSIRYNVIMSQINSKFQAFKTVMKG